MGDQAYPPEPSEDPGHILSEEDWAEVEKTRAAILDQEAD